MQGRVQGPVGLVAAASPFKKGYERGANRDIQERAAARRHDRLARPKGDGDARARELGRLGAQLFTLKDVRLSLQRLGAGKAEGLQPAQVFDKGA
jgi:hypothetical protein